MKNCKFCHSGNIIRTEYDFHDAYKCSACDKAFFEKIAECCRNPVDRYVDDFHNNVPVFIRVQCDNCGGCLNMTKSLKRAEFGEKTKGEFSKERFLECLNSTNKCNFWETSCEWIDYFFRKREKK